MTLLDAIPRIEAWNAARYDREYNEQLASALLLEEINEFYEAVGLPIVTYEDRLNRFVEIIDALGDVFFVAVGVLWKLNKPWSFNDVLYIRNDFNFLKSTDVNLISTDPVACAKLILAKVLHMASLAMTNEDFANTVMAICDSNDSKAIKKTDAAIKANIDKGAEYFSPTEALMEIAAKYVSIGDAE